MFRSVIEKTIALPFWVNSAAVLISFIGFGQIKNVLDRSYAASGHPVDFATGQTGFSGTLIKQYYAHMQEAGTIGIYWKTQFIDFGFILGMFLFALFASALIARFSPPDSWGRRIGIWAGIAVMTGTMFDVIENLISFVMLANPNEFANWIALPYSAVAVAKFACITVGMGLATAALCLALCSLFSCKQPFRQKT